MRSSARTEPAFLEYHHRQPFAAGGKATVENIELRCRAHNAYEAQLFFTGDVARESDVDSFWNELPPRYFGFSVFSRPASTFAVKL